MKEDAFSRKEDTTERVSPVLTCPRVPLSLLAVERWTLSVGRFLPVVLLILLILPEPVRAQRIILKTGQAIETQGLRRSGDKVMGKIQVGETSGEVGYAIATIAKIEFPEPRGIKNAAALLAQGQADKALAEIDQVVQYYQPFRDVPGAWWGEAALIKISALAALQREAEAEPLAQEIQKNTGDPETVRAARLRLVPGLIRKAEFEKATQICDAAIKESLKPEVLADAWVNKGHLYFSQREWDSALLAYLRVPIFYREQRLFMPVALLGAIKSYRRLGDLDRAKKSFNDLNTAFPKAPETALAQAEIQKM